jgi:hypothetical protein
MKHLTEAEFVDLIDGVLPAARAAHLDGCGQCRGQAAEMSAMLAETNGLEMPEPSPLFWNHFSARVADAVADEPPPAVVPGWTARLRNPAITWAAAASLALLMMVAALWRATLAPEDEHSAPGRSGLATQPADRPIDDLDQDEAWAVVRLAADDLVWEEAEAIGITARPGSAELAVLELSPSERGELARLLEEELRRTGA